MLPIVVFLDIFLLMSKCLHIIRKIVCFIYAYDFTPFKNSIFFLAHYSIYVARQRERVASLRSHDVFINMHECMRRGRTLT